MGLLIKYDFLPSAQEIPVKLLQFANCIPWKSMIYCSHKRKRGNIRCTINVQDFPTGQKIKSPANRKSPVNRKASPADRSSRQSKESEDNKRC